jgi:dCTP deaminase
MSWLCDRDIQHARATGQLEIAPFDPGNLQPASYDLTLGDEWSEPFMPSTPTEAQGWSFVHVASISREDARLPGVHRFRQERFTLMPGAFVLGCTQERIKLGPGLLAVVDGKSTLGRMGLLIHCTAGFIDPGFQGEITLELHNVAPYPIELVAWAPVAQLRVAELSGLAERPYGSPGLGSHYQGNTGAQPAR